MTNILLLLFLLGAVLIAGYFLSRLLRNLSRTPIPQINLSPIDTPKRSDSKKITDLICSFQQKGFQSAGDYECWEFPALIISGFVHPSEQMAGVIYDHPIRGIWVDIAVQYKNGSSLTVSSAPTGHELDTMPQQTKFYCKESSVDELLAKVSAVRKQMERITITKEDFASNFEAQYQKEMKWRIDQGGPTYLEVLKVAEEMGESTDRERLQNATQQMQHTWMQGKNKPRKTRNGAYAAVLPREFQRPEEFRRKTKEKSGPIPRLNVPTVPVYLVLISSMAYWCYYAYQYNKTHFPLSLTALIVFFLVFIVLLLATIGFSEFNRRARLYPVLKRMADLRHGAFLVIAGVSPTLFYARERWIGELSFERGGEHGDAFTRLDAIIKHPLGRLEINKKNILDKVIWGAEKDVIESPESDFSRKFRVSSSDLRFAGNLLNSNITNALMRLDKFGQPFVEINRNSARVEIATDLSSPRKEGALRQFLEEAETILETATT